MAIHFMLSFVLTLFLLASCDQQQPVFREVAADGSVYIIDQTSDQKIPDDQSNDDAQDNSRSDSDDNDSDRNSMYRISFNSHDYVDSTINQKLGQPWSRQVYKLQRASTRRDLVQRQSERPLVRQQLEQGHLPADKEDRFDQVVDRELDILIVIDDSRSMAEEQRNLASKLSPLLSEISETDWQIGVVTTDPNSSCLRNLIKKSDPNYEAKFNRAIKAGTRGSGNENGILMAVRGLQGQCLEQPWIRNDSTVSVLIVSDEDNCSNAGEGCYGKPWAESSFLIDYLKTIRDVGVTAKVNGLFWHPEQGVNECGTADNQGHVYREAVESSGGYWGSICDVDYTETLNGLSKDIEGVLRHNFILSEEPRGDVAIFVDEIQVTSGFSIEGKTLRFSAIPEEGAVIKAQYTWNGGPLINDFLLTEEPAVDTLDVRVNGVLEKDWILISDEGDHGAIKFIQPPAARSTIQITYRKEKVLADKFQLPEIPLTDSLIVRVNGVRTSSWFLAESVVEFNKPPIDGARIQFRYHVWNAVDPVLPFQVDHDVYELTVSDVETGQTISSDLTDDGIRIPETEYLNNRTIEVLYTHPTRSQLQLDIPQLPLNESVVISWGTWSCKPNVLLDSYGSVQLSGCALPSEAQNIRIDYKWLKSVRHRFDISSLQLPSDRQVTWKVFINGQVNDEWHIESSELVIDAEIESPQFIELFVSW
ncbi:MAG: hypothetical protein CMP10_11955 [Zetaproteobacteria bacterium]|nr:hypothetical protein [Pseudobdellovibrionaceae bacterium]